MIKKVFFAIIIFLGLCSCKLSSESNNFESVKIISPKENRNYYEDEVIFFTTNVDSKEIHWYSEQDGYLGNGNNINHFLSEGKHEIKCCIGNYEKKVMINVKSRCIKKGENVSYFLNDKSQVFLYPGSYSPIVCCLDNKVQSLFLQKKNNPDLITLKDIVIKNKRRTKKVYTTLYRSVTVEKQYLLGSKKDFYIAKTNNQFDEPYKKECVCIDIGKHYTAWVPIDDSYNFELIKACVKTFDDFLYTRIYSIWGEWADIDGDKKIALLFSSTINEEKYAIGFYNTNDLFSNEENNYSNQMDVLYLGVPEDENTSSYSISSITATIAHELTHAINFNQKSYQRILSGCEKIPEEEIFIDEAFSHLSENLCGYGISGGNIEFVKYYLKNSFDYSLCGKSRYGEDDSVGRRGAMLLFVSWLFWKKGGMLWNQNNPVEIIDNGGISFLRELVKSENSSWDNIGFVFGKPISQLFIEFASEINEQQFSDYSEIVDPVTGENITFHININNDSISLVENQSSIFEEADYLQWSINKKKTIKIETKGIYEIQSKNSKNFVLCLVKME